MEAAKTNKPQPEILEEKETLEITPETHSLVLHSPRRLSSAVDDYAENVVIREQPLRTASLPVYTLDWTSRTDPYFMPATGLDFLTGVRDVVLQQTSLDLTSRSDCKFLVKIPNEETLYLGVENSTSIQKALLCSQRSFHMTFLDPNKLEAATFVRKSAVTNYSTCFRQELTVSIPEKSHPVGRIIQDSNVSFSVLGEKNENLFKVVGSKRSFCWKLSDEVQFRVLADQTPGLGVINHGWDSTCRDFLYHITFPSSNTPLCHKVLLIGAAVLVEYTYFKRSNYSCGFT